MSKYKLIKKFFTEHYLIICLTVFLISFFLHLWIQNTTGFFDPDSFYHLKLGKIMLEHGPILDFPWLQFTVLKEYYIDHHFLFHIGSLPFIWLFGDIIGYKFYTIFLTSSFITIAYIFMRNLKVKLPIIFSFLLLLDSALLFRLALAKAIPFSLIILFLGIYLIFKRKYWYLWFVSFLYVWSYGGFILMLGMVIIYIMIDVIYNSLKTKYEYNFFNKEYLYLLLSVIIGLVAGLVINPYFPKNLWFYWQQVVEIGLINYQGIVNVGNEWYPYPFLKLITDSGALIIVLILSLALFIVFIKKQKTSSIFFFVNSFIFLCLTLKSKRYVEYFIPMTVFFTATSISYSLTGIKLKKVWQELISSYKKLTYLLAILIIIICSFIPIIFYKTIIETRQIFFSGGSSFNTYSGISEYLKKNTSEGEIVMYTNWSDFPVLFYQNSYNYYIVGLDPTFMYNYDPKLYHLFADITLARKKDNLYEDITEKFKARYFIVNKDRLTLASNLYQDGRFTMVYEDQDGYIFRAD